MYFSKCININKVFLNLKKKGKRKVLSEGTVIQPLPGFRVKPLGAATKSRRDKNRLSLWGLEQRDERTLRASGTRTDPEAQQLTAFSTCFSPPLAKDLSKSEFTSRTCIRTGWLPRNPQNDDHIKIYLWILTIHIFF